MNFLICVLYGIIAGYALKRRNGPDEFKLWRPVIAATAAAFPHLQWFFQFFGPTVTAWADRGPTWSLLLWPLWSLLLAIGFSALSKRKWEELWWLCFGTMGGSLLLSALTNHGIEPFAPLLSWRFSLPIAFWFDLIIFAILLTGVALLFLFRSYWRDVARATLIVLAVYLIVLGTFHLKARDFASRYAEAIKLDVARIDALPGPVSPFNWRLILETQDEQLHITRVNIMREKPFEIDPNTATRSYRIKALYQPLSQAIWQVYQRYGGIASEQEQVFVSESWQRLERSAWRWDVKYLIYLGVTDYKDQHCSHWQDVRNIGARQQHNWRNRYLMCRGETARWQFYKSRNAEQYVRLGRMQG